jgi:hypothetical protein
LPDRFPATFRSLFYLPLSIQLVYHLHTSHSPESGTMCEIKRGFRVQKDQKVGYQNHTHIVVVEDDISPVNWDFEVVCTKPYLVPFCARPMRPRHWESLKNWRLVEAILGTAGFHPRPDLSAMKTQQNVVTIEVTATHLKGQLLHCTNSI